MSRKEKKTKPTTVRLYGELDEFVREQAEVHPDGQSGVINDAVEHWMQYLELNSAPAVRRGETFYAAIVGNARGTRRAGRKRTQGTSTKRARRAR